MSKLRRLLRYDWPLHFVLLLTNWLPDNVPFLKLRGWLAGHFLGSCGNGLELGRNITFYNPSKIHVGSRVYVGYGCWIMAGEDIIIEDEVMFGPYCIVVSANHQRSLGSFRFAPPEVKPISIGRGAWIAGHVVVTAGSKIGTGTLIAASSVVNTSIPPRVLAAGQPATVRKSLID
jgi:acetyltransferase-like isoleucine patch superfamily enzyme